jgi:2-polyprenyl-3-methyl-5-hydroxy-6-metoxy-1,4-benzoquinol methylase
MMNPTADKLIELLHTRDPAHTARIRTMFESMDETYFENLTAFLDRCEGWLSSHNKGLDFLVGCYLRMCQDFLIEQVRFMQSGTYSNTSFADVEARIYSNPDIMEYYMYGLMLSQFLWRHHYHIYEFFMEHLPKHASGTKRYLEVGAGHGLYMLEARSLLSSNAKYTLIDISSKSIEIARSIIGAEDVNYCKEDIQHHQPDEAYDFVTMGEVLEHVEKPGELLQRLNEMTTDSARFFLTIPANAPAIDHIYYFKSPEHIRDTLQHAGLSVLTETYRFAEDLPEEEARERKVALMYAAFLKKS